MPRRPLSEVFEEFKTKIDALVGSKTTIYHRAKEFDKYKPYVPFTGEYTYNASFPQGQYMIADESKMKYDYGNQDTWKVQVSTFALNQLPGCCGICVLYHTFVYGVYQKKGLGRLIHQFKIEMAKQMGYGLALATNVTDQTAMDKIQDKFKWNKLHTFQNPRTAHYVNIKILPLT